MKKNTVLSFHKESAKIDITLSINRIYGNEEETINLDGDVFPTTKFYNDVFVNVTVEGSLHGRCHFSRNPISSRPNKMKGIQMTLSTKKDSSYKNGKNCFIVFEDEWIEQVNAVCSEVLTDETDPEIKKEIIRLKEKADAIIKAENDGFILPAAELQAKRKEYKEGMLEGGEGYNPYDHYFSREEVKRFKTDHPELF